MVEIQAGEGGDDAKLFVTDLLDMYQKYAQQRNLKSEVLHSAAGHKIVQFSGVGAGRAFRNETGKHVVQRNPPTENNGRRHTSVVSVAVLPLPPEKETESLPESELEIQAITGTGPGGQNRNKVASCIRMRHKPTGITVVIDNRDQWQNRRDALRILTARVNEKQWSEVRSKYDSARKQVLGDAGRGDKVRTYNFIQSRVVDHRLNKKSSQIKRILKGELQLLFA